MSHRLRYTVPDSSDFADSDAVIDIGSLEDNSSRPRTEGAETGSSWLGSGSNSSYAVESCSIAVAFGVVVAAT